MLWGLPYALLLSLGAIPLILFLNSLKPKGLKVRTTTLFLWERVMKERPLATRLGWLFKKNLLLMLQLLAAALLIVALADPSLLHLGTPSGDLVVVVDLSASMKAKGRFGSRFDAGRKEFLSLVEGLASGQKMMVVGAGAQTRLMVPFTADKQRLRETGRRLAATDAPGQVKEAILFAHGFLKRGSPDRVVVISDGAFDGAEEFTRQAAHLQFITVDGGRDNVGIVAFEARRRPDRSAQVEVMVHLRNFTTRAVTVPVALALSDQTLVRETVEMEPLGRRVLIYPLAGKLAGTLVARLEIQDDFATDNQSYLAVTDAPPVRLLYVGPGNPLLSNLLRFFPQVQLATAERWEGSQSQQTYDLVILDRVAVPALTRGNFILINTSAPNLPLQMQAPVRTSRVVGPLAKHPITDGLSLVDLNVREAPRMTLQGEGTVLARAAETPLLFALEKRGLRLLLIGFDLMASDLPLRVAFPLLFHNALEWFQPQRPEFPAQTVQAGNPFALHLPAADGELEITNPTGNKEVLKAVTSPVVFTETMEAGFYRYKSASREGRFAVNLGDEGESQIASRLQLSTAARPATERAGGLAAHLSLWPWLLGAVLIVLALEIFLAYRVSTPIYPIVVRGAALTVLALALIDLRIFTATDALDVIVSVDVSRSVGQEGREKARQILEAAGRLKGPETRTGVLLFGRSPEWEFGPRENFPVADFASRFERDETDIQAAMQAAAAQIGEGRQGKILLISDGNENRGAIARVLPLLHSQGAQVWTLPVNVWRGKNEVYVGDFQLPRQVDSAQGFEITANIESLRSAPARVKLLRDGVLQNEHEIKLAAGSNAVKFSDSLRERGSHSYEFLVESPDDTFAENNLVQGVVEVKGPPRVLLLSAQKESQRFLSRVLQVQGYSVVEAAAEAHSLSLPELSSFDLMVLDNVPAFQLSHSKMENIEKYVRDLGGGLLVIGGSQSYGAGGYYRTPLERVLPVDMRPPARLDLPHVALLFVIDKSGSMGAGAEGSTKLDLAKAAAIAAADVMNPTDQVGILAFDASFDWVLPFRAVGKGEWISERLAGLQSDGGTDLYKAMVEAYRSIASKQAAIKHVLVLSDGLTDKADFHGLVEKMARDNVTVSTVSVGNDADVQLMADIAKHGKGRGYVALDPQTIPQIFTTETLLISRDLLVEKTFTPTVVAWTGPLKGLAGAQWPSLRGYVLTYPKPRAELLMNAERDPLLVSWRYGLGRVMAFTSDLSGRWGKEWVAWQGFPQWASQLSRDTMRKMLETTMRAEFHSVGDSVKVTADFVSKAGGFHNYLKLRSNIAAPNRATHEQVFQQTAPGRYQTQFRPAQRGIHLLTLYAEGQAGEAPVPVTTVPYIAPYPKEYRELKPNMALLSRLAEETGGEMLEPDKIEEGVKRLYTPSPGKSTRGQETWWPLAGLGLLLFLADLVLRSWPGRERVTVAPRAF
ncbi:MAG TPA: VWA domain-containing protein [Candidatus Binatia bacterium]|nr:VWA domain-containing protein [Candidatus Binatia bacterium]